MEVAGVVLGLAGLYSPCTELINRIDTYKNFGSDSRHLSAQSLADKVYFYQWAESAGLSQKGLADVHDGRLDNVATAQAVVQVLRSIFGLLQTVDEALSKLDTGYEHRGASSADSLSSNLRDSQAASAGNSFARKRRKLTWSLGGKSRLNTQTEVFKSLVEKLYNLVPPKETLHSIDELVDQLTTFEDTIKGKPCK